MFKDLSCNLQKNQAYLVFDEKNRFYLTGFKSSAGYLLITSTFTSFYIDDRYFSVAKERLSSKMQVFRFQGEQVLFEELKNLGITELLIDYEATVLSNYFSFVNEGFSVVNCNELLSVLKMVKKEEELTKIKKACDIAYQAFLQTLPIIKAGVTEKQVKNHLENRMILLGADKTSFDTIIAFGKNSAVPHHETGDTVLKNGQCVLMDFGCEVEGYCSDITRTLFVGEPDDKFLRVYDAVLGAKMLSEDKISSGISGVNADKIARDYLTILGFGENFTHSLGHGIGLNIHERPYLSKKSSDLILEGMVFSVEPGIYFDGEFGVRIEDTVVLKDGKVLRLFNDDKKLIVLHND